MLAEKISELREELDLAIYNFFYEDLRDAELLDYTHIFVTEEDSIFDKSRRDFRVTVQSELDLDVMYQLSEKLNEVVNKYEDQAYFDTVEPGIMECIIPGPEIKKEKTL